MNYRLLTYLVAPIEPNHHKLYHITFVNYNSHIRLNYPFFSGEGFHPRLIFFVAFRGRFLVRHRV